MPYHIFSMVVFTEEREADRILHSLGALFSGLHKQVRADGETGFGTTQNCWTDYMGTAQEFPRLVVVEPLSVGEILSGEPVRPNDKETPTNSPQDKNDRQ